VLLWWRRRPGLQALFTEFDARFYTDHIIPYEQAARRLVTALLAGSSVTLLVLTTLVCHGLFSTDPRMNHVYHTAMIPYSHPNDAGEITYYLLKGICRCRGTTRRATNTKYRP